jgi:molecular chaperone GrpE
MAGEITDEDMMGEESHLNKEAKKNESAKEEVKEPELIDFPDRETLEKKLTEAEDKALRALAEMENVRRRADQRVQEAHKYAVSKLLEELIPVLDSLEQSLMIPHADHELVKSMREGMGLTLQMMTKTLEKFGVKTINPLNEMFNPALHEVMMAEPKADVAPNTITAVMQKGYQLHERLIRPARVMIAKAPA